MRRFPMLAIVTAGLCAVLFTSACTPAEIEAARAAAESAAARHTTTSTAAPTSTNDPTTDPTTVDPTSDVPTSTTDPTTTDPTTPSTTDSRVPTTTTPPTTTPPTTTSIPTTTSPTGTSVPPTSTVTTTTAPSNGPRPGLLWTGDAETGDVSQFQNAPWNDVGGTKPAVVTSPVRDGKYAIRLGLGGATTSADGICCGSRDELLPKFRDLKEGDDLYFGFSTYLAPGFSTNADWQVITQFKQNFDGSPPLSLNVAQGQYKLEGGYGYPGGSRQFTQPIGTASTGTWVDWVLHVKFSSNPSVGYVEVWQNGSMVVSRFSPAGGTLYPASGSESGGYVKTGLYRDPSISTPATMYMDSWRIGTTMEAVVR